VTPEFVFLTTSIRKAWGEVWGVFPLICVILQGAPDISILGHL